MNKNSFNRTSPSEQNVSPGISPFESNQQMGRIPVIDGMTEHKRKDALP